MIFRLVVEWEPQVAAADNLEGEIYAAAVSWSDVLHVHMLTGVRVPVRVTNPDDGRTAFWGRVLERDVAIAVPFYAWQGDPPPWWDWTEQQAREAVGL